MQLGSARTDMFNVEIEMFLIAPKRLNNPQPQIQQRSRGSSIQHLFWMTLKYAINSEYLVYYMYMYVVLINQSILMIELQLSLLG